MWKTYRGTISEGLGDEVVAEHGLHPPTTATTVRVRAGDVLFTDGPFAETKEQMGGLAVIDRTSEAEARELASTRPWARYGMIEIRQILP